MGNSWDDNAGWRADMVEAFRCKGCGMDKTRCECPLRDIPEPAHDEPRSDDRPTVGDWDRIKAILRQVLAEDCQYILTQNLGLDAEEIQRINELSSMSFKDTWPPQHHDGAGGG